MKLSNKKSNGNRLNHIEKVAIKSLLSIGKSGYSISKETGISQATIGLIRKDPTILPQHQVDAIKKGLTGNLYNTAHRAIETIDQEKLNQASALQLATVAGITIEKARLMENQSTSNVSMISAYTTITDSLNSLSNKYFGQFTSDNNNYDVKSEKEKGDTVTGRGEDSKP